MAITEKVSLNQFIENHYKLITTMGVAGALTAFFVNLENGETLASLSFLIFVVVAWELWVLFPRSEKASIRLRVFQWLFYFLSFNVAMYVLFWYSQFLWYLPWLLALLYGGILVEFFRKQLEILRKPITKKTIIEWSLLIISALLLGAITAFLTTLLFPP